MMHKSTNELDLEIEFCAQDERVCARGLTDNPALAPFANVPCRCQRYFMGGEGAGTTSTPASIMLLIGPARTTMPYGR
jgi:hypothetical protein